MKSILGSRIRERRRDLKITQADLASRIGISASYLNLIEHNKRNIAGGLLVRVAQALNLNTDELDGEHERKLLSELEGIANIPAIATIDLETKRAGELIGRYPGWSKALAALARSEQQALETARLLADRLTHDSFLNESILAMLTSTASIRSAIEILIEYKSINNQQRSQFEHIINKECQNLTLIGEALATYFDRDEQSEKILTPTDEVELMFKSNQNRFEQIESAVELWLKQYPDFKVNTLQQARQIIELEFSDLINQFITRQPEIETELAKSKAENDLVNYTACALCLPCKEFHQQALELNYDIEALTDIFSVPIEMIFERLTNLPNTNENPSFGYYLTNASGTIISIRTIDGLNSLRYASACPIWVLYRAQQSPGNILRQRVIFPSGNRFVFIARARQIGSVGYGKPQHFVTDMLVMYEEDASQTIYALDDAVPLEKVGSSCRSCPRHDCNHRVTDPMTG